jgi:hypothetical protein
MPSDRRIIFSSYVSPTQSETMEEDAISRKSFISSPGKSLGGKGTASITATQWNDGWTSMYHPHDNKVSWNQLDDSDDVSGDKWEDVYTTWSGVYVAIAPETLTPSLSDPLKFLYIRNVHDPDEDDNYALLRIQNDAEEFGGNDTTWSAETQPFTEPYKIKISPGASICLRGDGTNLEVDEVFVAGSHTGTKIEYIIAK